MSKQNRLVSFQEDDLLEQVIEIPSRDDFAEEQLSSLYFLPSELQEIRHRDNQLILELFICGRISSDEDDSTGLDTVNTNSIRKRQALISLQTVLTEQELECIEGVARDNDYIAKIYEYATRKNKLMALSRGLDSALQVKTGRLDDPMSTPQYRSTITADRIPHRTNNGNVCTIESTNESPSCPPDPPQNLQHYQLIGRG